MRFEAAITSALRKYAEFDGRATRPEYWWFALFTTLSSLAASALFVGLGAAWSIAMLLPILAVSVRRLRDSGYHWGWLFLLLLPLVGLIIVIIFLAQPSQAQLGEGADIATRVPPQV